MDVIVIVKEYLEKQSNILFAYVFGSYAKGNATSSSDIDLAIYLYPNAIDLDDYLSIRKDLMNLTRMEIDLVLLNDAEPLIKYRVIQEGILLFTRNEQKEKTFKVNVLFEYDDVKKYLDLSYNTMIDRLRKEIGNGCSGSSKK